MRIVAPTLRKRQHADELALAKGVDPLIISALGAPAGGLADLLPSAMRTSLALSATIASLIGADAERHVLATWGDVAHAGCGASHAVALVSTMPHKRCESRAAALIGSTNDVAALLTWTDDIAHVDG